MDNNLNIENLTEEQKFYLAIDINRNQISQAINKGVSKSSNEFLMLLAQRDELYQFNQDVVYEIINEHFENYTKKSLNEF